MQNWTQGCGYVIISSSSHEDFNQSAQTAIKFFIARSGVGVACSGLPHNVLHSSSISYYPSKTNKTPAIYNLGLVHAQPDWPTQIYMTLYWIKSILNFDHWTHILDGLVIVTSAFGFNHSKSAVCSMSFSGDVIGGFP